MACSAVGGWGWGGRGVGWSLMVQQAALHVLEAFPILMVDQGDGKFKGQDSECPGRGGGVGGGRGAVLKPKPFIWQQREGEGRDKGAA